MNISKTKWFDYLLVKGKTWYFYPIFLCLAGTTYLGYLVPIYVKDLYEYYGNSVAYSEQIFSLGIVFIGTYILRVAYGLIVTRYVQHLVVEIRTKSYTNWLSAYEAHQEFKENRKKHFPQGEVISRIMNDTEATRELVTSGSFGIIADALFIVACLYSFAQLHFSSGMLLIGAEVVACLLLLWGSRYMARVFLKVRQAQGEMSRTVANVVGGFGEAYYNRHENYASKKSVKGFNEFLKFQLKANTWDASYYSLAESMYPILLLLFVSTIPFTGIKEAAIVAVMIDLIQRSIGPIKDVTAKVANIQRAATGLFRIREFQDYLEEHVQSTTRPQIPLDSFTGLEVNLPKFTFNHKEGESSFSLKNIKFKGKKGELIGLVGLSGSGKSTLLNILAGDIVPHTGEVSIQGESHNFKFPGSIDDILAYRRQVGIVSQDSHVFSETLAYNIHLNQRDEKEFGSFWESCLEKLPYLTPWGIGPEDKIDLNSLSLGQKQLISALRACFLKKPIVLLDEVSSGLDGKLEESLRKLVLEIQKQSLTIIVAHRVETIIKANLILVLHQGEIIQRGIHKDLLQSSKVYQEFIKEVSAS